MLVYCLTLILTLEQDKHMENKFKKLLETIGRPNYVEKTIEDVYQEIAGNTDLTPREVAMIGGVESQHGKYEDNMTGSSAKGIMQVMPSLAKLIRPGSENNIKDRNVQADLVSDIINYNTPTIKEIATTNRNTPSVEDQYALYNLGMGRGKKYLMADDETPIKEILPEKVIKSNPKLYKYKTVGKSKEALRQFLKDRGEEFNFTIPETKLLELFANKEEQNDE
jgi:hypothetical protein